MAELKIISMDEVPVEEVEWLWYPYIPYGKLTIIHGDGGEGKTTLILRLAALLSRGEKLNKVCIKPLYGDSKWRIDLCINVWWRQENSCRHLFAYEIF